MRYTVYTLALLKTNSPLPFHDPIYSFFTDSYDILFSLHLHTEEQQKLSELYNNTEFLSKEFLKLGYTLVDSVQQEDPLISSTYIKRFFFTIT